jgi:general secretion pathway protein D
MKKSGALAIGLLAAMSSVALAQDSSSKLSSGGHDIVDLITRFAKRANKQVIIDPRVRTSIPLAGIDPNNLSYEQLLAILDVNQFAAYEVGGIITVTIDSGSRQFPTPVHDDVRFKALDHEIVTLLVTTKNVCANQLVPVLRPLMPQAAHLAAEPQTNTLIINDHAVNARRIAELVSQLDKHGTGKKDCWPPAPREAAPPAAKPGS